MSGSWLDELEERLERQLEAFLQANPGQESLLADQEAQDRHQALLAARLRLRQQAEQERRVLLQLAEEIRLWQGRIDRARAAGAGDLAERAEVHVAGLMERGRRRWDGLAELGRRHGELERELAAAGTGSGRAAPTTGTAANGTAASGAAASGAAASGADELELAWTRFETDQDLEELRRRTGL